MRADLSYAKISIIQICSHKTAGYKTPINNSPDMTGCEYPSHSMSQYAMLVLCVGAADL